MRKTPLLLAFILSSVLLAPVQNATASSLDKINQEITQIKEGQHTAESRIKAIDREKIEVQTQKNQANDELGKIDQNLKDTQERIDELDLQIGQTTLRAQDAAVQFEAAVKRVEERDKLLKTRVKVMYELGDVSYFDVLLGAENFGDFLDRLNSVKTIVDQDVQILEANIADQEVIEAKKREVEMYLARLSEMMEETFNLKEDIERQKQERTQFIADLTKKQEELEKLRQEQEQSLFDNMHSMREVMSEKDQALRQNQFTDGRFTWPVPSSQRITSNFGFRTDPFTGRKTGHDGLDIAAPTGSTIVAATDGIVVVAGQMRGYGNTVSIDHGGDITTLYAHIRDGGIKVRTGQKVSKGEKIAEVGSTGRSTGPHLHFGVYKGKAVLNPMSYLQ